jgi:hypothetical protein
VVGLISYHAEPTIRKASRCSASVLRKDSGIANVGWLHYSEGFDDGLDLPREEFIPSAM